MVCKLHYTLPSQREFGPPVPAVQTLTTKDCKGPQTNMPESAFFKCANVQPAKASVSPRSTSPAAKSEEKRMLSRASECFARESAMLKLEKRGENGYYFYSP